jgi:hypothetical protein
VRRDEVIAAYGQAAGLALALPSAAVQGLLRLSDAVAGSAEASGWIERLDAAASNILRYISLTHGGGLAIVRRTITSTPYENSAETP